jgi:tetratricopeptide (TPR) repeat protein
LTGRGAVAATGERWAEAEKFFREALEEDSKNDNAIAGLGICATQRGDMEQAWECYTKASQLNPENKRALLGIIQTGYPLKKLEGVEKVLNVYLEHHPADLDILYSLAGCYFAQGRKGEALSQLEKIRLFDPQHQLANELHSKISSDAMGRSIN